MRVTENFTLEELTYSPTATQKGIDNTPSDVVVDNLTALATCLEAVRKLVNKPIKVSSAYRSHLLNKAVGGSISSAHVAGLAADINVLGMSPKQLGVLIRDSGIKFDQLIVEPTWVHIGLSTTPLRNQVLTAKMVAGKMKYFQGII